MNRINKGFILILVFLIFNIITYALSPAHVESVEISGEDIIITEYILK